MKRKKAQRREKVVMGGNATLKIAAERKNLVKIRRFIAKEASAFRADPKTVGDLILAVDEAIANIIIHGYQDRGGMVEIELGRLNNDLLVWLRDQAPIFDPTKLPLPDITEPLESRNPGGLGIYIMRKSVDEILHRITENGQNELTFIKNMVFC